MIKYKIRINKITIFPFGSIIDTNIKYNEKSYIKFLIAFGGVIFQLFLYFIFYYLFRLGIIFRIDYQIFMRYNLMIILFNLLWRRFMYKNIIFDLGNVLLDFNPRDYLKNKISDDKLEDVFKAVFTSEEWIMLDRGTITEKEAINNIISRNSTYIKEINLAFESWYDILKPIEESINILMSLKKNGYKIYYLSNFHQLAFAEVTKKNSFFELFDGGVVSYEEKLIKPEEDIYKLVLDRYKLNPSETIFIDDTKVNVDAANSIGIKGILFKDSEKLREELNSLEVKI